MNRPLFRQEALDRLASPDRLDQLMPLTSPHGWIALAGVGLLLLLSVLWGVFGSIAVTVRGDGCLIRGGGVQSITAPTSGVITERTVEAGTLVKKGQRLARLAARDITSPIDGRVLSVRVRPGDAVEAGTRLFKLEDLAQPLRAILYVPARQGAQIQRGQFVSVAVAGHRAGRVRSVERFPSSRSSLMRTLESEEWVEQVLRNGPVLEVVVDFGDDWSGDEDLYSGTPCQGQITVEQRAPIRFVLGRP